MFQKEIYTQSSKTKTLTAFCLFVFKFRTNMGGKYQQLFSQRLWLHFTVFSPPPHPTVRTSGHRAGTWEGLGREGKASGLRAANTPRDLTFQFHARLPLLSLKLWKVGNPQTEMQAPGFQIAAPHPASWLLLHLHLQKRLPADCRKCKATEQERLNCLQSVKALFKVPMRITS